MLHAFSFEGDLFFRMIIKVSAKIDPCTSFVLFQSSIALPFSCFYTSKIVLNILNQGLGNTGERVKRP
jgi:hypothetical protein